jgi:hypothetical protein
MEEEVIAAGIINGTGAVCDQKTSKFFVPPHIEEFTAGHMGVNRVLLKVRKGKYKGEHGDTQVLFRCFKNLWEGDNKEITIQ